MPQTRKQTQRERARLELLRRTTEGIVPSEPTKELLDLPNEMLLMVIEACHPQTAFCHGRCRSVLACLSAACRRLRVLSIPTLFRETHISDKFTSTTDQIHWSLRQLSHNPEILNAIRCLTFRARRNPNVGPYHPETPRLFIDCLRSMPKLQEVKIQFFHGAIHYLVPLLASQLVFRPRKTFLTNVTTLHLTSAMPPCLAKGLLKMFPNVRNLAVHVDCIPHSPLLQLAGKANMEYVKVSRDKVMPRSDDDYAPGWSQSAIKEVAKLIPRVPHLALVGYMEEVKVKDLAETFKGFTRLEWLDLTDEQVVEEEAALDFIRDLEDDGYPDMSDGTFPMDDPVEGAYMLVEAHDLNEDRELVAKAYFAQLSALKRLCLSRLGHGDLFEPVRDSHGNVTGVTMVSSSHAYTTQDKNDKHRAGRQVQIEWDNGFPLVAKLRGLLGTY